MTKPPVTCGNCGVAVVFERDQLVGNPDTLDRVVAMREALKDIAEATDDQSAWAQRARAIAEKALDR